VPRVLLRNFLDKPDVPFRAAIPIFGSLISARDCRLLHGTQSGDPLQSTVEQMILARFQVASLGRSLRMSSAVAEHFRWLSNTHCGTLRFTACLTAFPFPKIVNDSEQNSGQVMGRKHIRPQLFVPNSVYLPEEKSSFSDMSVCGYLVTNDNGLTQIQIKHHSVPTTFGEADFHSEVFKAYVPEIKSTLLFVCTNTHLPRNVAARAEKRDLLGQPILPPHAQLACADGRPANVIPQDMEVATGVWYFTSDTCDKMRASHVLSSYVDKEHKEQRDDDASHKRHRSSALDYGPDPFSAMLSFQQSMWALPPHDFRTQLLEILKTIPRTFALAHLRFSFGFQDALFLSAEAVRDLLHEHNYDLLVARRQVASVCSVYNREFSHPLDDSEINEALLLHP